MTANSWSWSRRVEGRRSDRLAIARALIDCARADGPRDPSGAVEILARSSSQTVMALVRFHGVGGLLYQALRPLDGVPTELIADLRSEYDQAVQGHLRMLWELAHLQPTLDATGVPWAIVKGPVAVERLYLDPGLRAYQDLDLLVDPAGFRVVIEALRTSGSEVLDRNWTLLREDLLGEVHLRLRGGTPLDLHWNLINVDRGDMWVDSSEVLGRVIRTTLGGVAAGILDPEDTLVHLAMHAALSGGDRLRWLTDIDRAARALEPDWELVSERSRRWGVAEPVGLMLGRTRAVLSSPIPSSVPAALLGAPSRRFVRLAERVSPWELSVGRLTALSHVVSRNIAKGPIGATAWLVRRAIKWLDPREPAASSAFTPRGGEQDRAAFIDAVVHSSEMRPGRAHRG